MQLYDSRQKQKVAFVPCVPGKVGMYLCGPTVYDAPHIGHARSAIAFDVIRRYFAWRGFHVTFVRNITDVDDKIIKRAQEQGVPSSVVAARYTEEYEREMAALGVKPPDVAPKVTEHMPIIIDFIEKLMAADKAYVAGGDVYYRVAAFLQYGALSGQSIDALRVGARIEPDECKQSPLDFALWKAAKPLEPSWDSPWGPGRPGWHIECSAMAHRYLGDTFDLHLGGKDLIFPHHENEVAQSQGLLGVGTFARYFMHNGFLNIAGEKMSKSLGNVLWVSDLRQRYEAEAIRLFLVQQHYRSPIQFEVAENNGSLHFPGLEEAERRLDYFYSTLARLDLVIPEAPSTTLTEHPMLAAVQTAMDDDFNTAVVVAELGEACKEANRLLDEHRRVVWALLRDAIRHVAQQILGILNEEPQAFLMRRRAHLAAQRGLDVRHLEMRIRAREEARRAKDFAHADAIRNELRHLGVEIMDTPRGTEWRIASF